MSIVTASDISQVCRIERSATKQIWLTFGSILFVVIGWWMINDPAIATKRPYALYAGWISVIIFSVFGISWAYRLAFGERWPVALSAEGLTDLRISRTLVPWHSVKNIETKVVRSVSFLCIDIDQQFKLELSAFGRMIAALNAANYGCRYFLVSTDLKLPFARLQGLVHSYWRAHGSPSDLCQAIKL
jgi:hypothetical protein